MKKARILWISDGVTPTGFSRVSHSIVKNLTKNKYDIHWLAVNYWGDPHPYSEVKIYPASLKGDVYGINRLSTFAEVEFDMIFILNDAWVQDSYLEAIKKNWEGKKLPKIVTYTPVDATYHDSNWYRNFDIVSVPVAYTKFGKDEMRTHIPFKNIKIIPHGVDKSKFYKIDKSKEQIKKEFYPDNKEFYEDSFIILNANRNQPRKKIEISMQGFSLFANGKPENIKFYYHGGVRDSGLYIDKLAERYGISSRFILTNLKNGPQIVPDEHLNMIYNATDVGINTSLGEGWSLTNIEHVVTGAPQIVPDHSACKELYHDCGILLPIRQSMVLDNVNTEGGLVSPEDVATALQILYENKELYKQISDKGLKKFTSKEYEWEVIAKQWESIFDEVLDADNVPE